MDSADPLPNTTQLTSPQDKNNKNKQKLKEHAPPPPPTTASATSSPSHEFSFTISLHSSNPNSISTSAASPWNNCKSPNNNSFAIDLSPADEIFFHGHLLPLGLLSHLPNHSISPRSSTASIGLPINDTSPKLAADSLPPVRNNSSPKHIRPAKKSKSFSLFGLPGWKQSGERDESRKKQKKFSRLVKRYLAMVKKPLISFKQQWRGSSEENGDIEIRIDRDSSYSFSGQITGGGRDSNKYMKKQDFFSAPASMRTSPANSGQLVPVPTAMHSDNSSTMEELQAAIQAAIAHCKNSIATADQAGKLVMA